MADLGELQVGFATGELLSRDVREVRFTRTDTVQGSVSATLEIGVVLPAGSAPEETMALVERFLAADGAPNANT